MINGGYLNIHALPCLNKLEGKDCLRIVNLYPHIMANAPQTKTIYDECIFLVRKGPLYYRIKFKDLKKYFRSVQIKDPYRNKRQSWASRLWLSRKKRIEKLHENK